MRNFVALLLLLAAVAAVAFLSPDPLYVRSQEEDGSVSSSVLKGVTDATRDTYQSASQYAEKTGESIRDAASNVAERVQSAVGANPECEDPGAETRSGASLFDITRLKNEREPQEAQPRLLSRAAETVGFGKSAEHHEAEEVSKWQKAKEKLAEASAAASEAAAHVREALFHKSQKVPAKAQESTASYGEQAAETLKRAGERLQEGAQSTYSTLGDTAGKAKETVGSAAEKAKETVGSAAEKAKETLGSAADSARQAAGSAYETASQTAGSASETAGGAYGTARDKASDAAGSVYRSAKEQAGLAFDRASQGAGSAYEAVYIAIQILREFPAKAGGAVSEAGSSAYETVSGSSAYEKASGAGSSAYESVKQAPQGVKETVEDTLNYVRSKMPSFGQETQETQQPGYVKIKVGEATEGVKQRARDVGEHMPNVGEGLSYGSTDEGPLEALKRKLAGGGNEEEKGFLDEFRKKLSGYDKEERKQILDYIKEKVPGFSVKDEDDKRSVIEEYARKLATTPSKDDRRTILDGVREMLAGYSKEERRGILDGLKERLSSYISQDEKKGAVEAWKERVSVYFSSAYYSLKGEGGKGPTLDDITKRLAGSSGEERKGIIEGLKDTLQGFTREERKGPLDILREKLSIYSSKDEGKSILEELRERFGTDESSRDTQPQKSYYDSAKDAAKSGADKVSEYADRAKESAAEAGEKLGEERLKAGDNADKRRNVSQACETPGSDAARRLHGAVSQGSERLGGYVGGARNLIPEDHDEKNQEFYAWIHGQQIAGNSEDSKDSTNDTTGESDEQHQGKDARASPDAPECRACGMDYLEAVGPIAGAAGAYEIEKISKSDSKPEAASADQEKQKEDDLAKTDVGRPDDSTKQQEQTKQADEFVANLSQGPAALPKTESEDLPVEKVSELPTGGFFTSLGRLIHLASFSLGFGISVWMTFISGQVLSKALPRQQFGYVQSRLFPASLMVVAVAQAATLLMHVLRHPWSSSDASERLQFMTLCFSLSANLINAFYLEPQVSKLMFERLKLEKEEGTQDGAAGGKAPSTGRDAELVKHFNILHGYSSLVNLLSLVGQTWHMWYLARRLVI